jgi:hypothetical protein
MPIFNLRRKAGSGQGTPIELNPFKAHAERKAQAAADAESARVASVKRRELDAAHALHSKNTEKLNYATAKLARTQKQVNVRSHETYNLAKRELGPNHTTTKAISEDVYPAQRMYGEQPEPSLANATYRLKPHIDLSQPWGMRQDVFREQYAINKKDIAEHEAAKKEHADAVEAHAKSGEAIGIRRPGADLWDDVDAALTPGKTSGTNTPSTSSDDDWFHNSDSGSVWDGIK